MQKTRIEQYQEELRRTGGYATPPERRAERRAKPSAWNTFRYTLGITKVFPYCALMEPFGLLTTEKWAKVCFSSVTTAESLGINVVVEGFDRRIPRLALEPHRARRVVDFVHAVLGADEGNPVKALGADVPRFAVYRTAAYLAVPRPKKVEHSPPDSH